LLPIAYLCVMDYGNSGIPRKQNDRYLKDIFEQNFADFLRFVFPDADGRFDLSREIEFLDKEFALPSSERGDGTGNRVVDLLAKVQTWAGGEKWILVHTEIEGGQREDLPLRIFDYWLRIWLKHKHKRVVETVVFFTGGERQPKPSMFEMGTETTGVRFHYQTCDIHGFSESELMEMENPFSIVVLACRASLLEGKMPDRELNKIRIDIAKKMLRQGYGRERTEMFLFFLWNIIYTRDPKVNREYLEEIGILTRGTIDMNTIELARKYGMEDGIQWGMEKGIQQGLEKGLEKGIQQGKKERSLSIAREMKMEGVPVEQIAKFTKLTPGEIGKL